MRLHCNAKEDAGGVHVRCHRGSPALRHERRCARCASAFLQARRAPARPCCAPAAVHRCGSNQAPPRPALLSPPLCRGDAPLAGHNSGKLRAACAAGAGARRQRRQRAHQRAHQWRQRQRAAQPARGAAAAPGVSRVAVAHAAVRRPAENLRAGSCARGRRSACTLMRCDFINMRAQRARLGTHFCGNVRAHAEAGGWEGGPHTLQYAASSMLSPAAVARFTGLPGKDVWQGRGPGSSARFAATAVTRRDTGSEAGGGGCSGSSCM